MQMQRWMRGLLGCMVLMTTAPAWSAVDQASATGFVISWQKPVTAPPAHVFEAVGQVNHWWNSEHTWSGDAANLSLGLTAGACFCEQWANGSVEHGRVIFIAKNKMVRLQSSLGPLQGLAVNGILDFVIEPAGDQSLLKLRYRVSGNADAALDKHAPGVDRVLGEQLGRLVKFAESGSAQ
ncbi:MAG: hypothetical protein JO142_15870 [Burkholderiales bacterium]|nr:hypothetical protein [Burkholderiales bacterium]